MKYQHELTFILGKSGVAPEPLSDVRTGDTGIPVSKPSVRLGGTGKRDQLRLVQGPEESRYGSGTGEIHDSPTTMSRSGQEDNAPPPSYNHALGGKS